MGAEAIRTALRCDRPGCLCQRPRGHVHCPAHDDENPDLSVDENGGRVLVHCFAGCAQDDVISALRERGLWRGGPSAPALSRLRRRGDAAELEGPLVDALRFVGKYVVVPSDHAAVAVALWVAHAHALDAFETTPYLLASSPEKRSGKTRLLEVLGLLAPRAWHVVQPSEAVLFRYVAARQPTLLLDEADAIFRSADERTEPLRAILNAGFRRGATVPRCAQKGNGFVLEEYPVFCAKALAAIGRLPDTVEDRSIVIRLQRATPAEQRDIRRLRLREAEEEAKPIREALAKWAAAALPRLRNARPAIPDQLDGRAADAWEPLLAVAEQAGDGWAVVAWEAALALSTGAAREDESLRVRLLADVRRVFEDKQADRLATKDLLEALAEDEAAPWGDFYGRRLTPEKLAQLLRPFAVAPERWREGSMVVRGYTRGAFSDAWNRYLPPPPGFNLAHPSQAASINGFGGFRNPSQGGSVTGSENGESPRLSRAVPGVTGSTPTKGGKAVSEVPGASPPVPPDGPCATCGRTRFWTSIHDKVVCATCHPPAAPDLVESWWVRRPSGRWLRVRPVHQTRRWRCASPPEIVRQVLAAHLSAHPRSPVRGAGRAGAP